MLRGGEGSSEAVAQKVSEQFRANDSPTAVIGARHRIAVWVRSKELRGQRVPLRSVCGSWLCHPSHSPGAPEVGRGVFALKPQHFPVGPEAGGNRVRVHEELPASRQEPPAPKQGRFLHADISNISGPRAFWQHKQPR